MKWTIKQETDKTRIYANNEDSNEIETYLIYTDKLGNRWFGFRDLFQIPYLRTAYSKTISDLFKVGLTGEDIKTWIKKEKELLKSNDSEKYEKLYALVLEKESIISTVVDPLKQHLALCTIYVLGENEAIDQYSQKMAADKLELWKLDEDAQAFFLTWQTGRIASYMGTLNNLSQIVSSLETDQNPKE